MNANRKYNNLKPKKKSPLDPYKIRAKINHFDPEAVIEDYLDQDRAHLRNLNPKAIYEVQESVENQASRIIKKFGGVPALLTALTHVGYSIKRIAIYKWTYPPERGGTGGVIPTRVMPFIHAAARLFGVFLSSEDLDARVDHIKKFKTVATTRDGKLIPFIDSLEYRALELHEIAKTRRAQGRARRRERVKNSKSAGHNDKSTCPKSDETPLTPQQNSVDQQKLIDQQNSVDSGHLSQIDIRNLRRGNS